MSVFIGAKSSLMALFWQDFHYNCIQSQSVIATIFQMVCVCVCLCVLFTIWGTAMGAGGMAWAQLVLVHMPLDCQPPPLGFFSTSWLHCSSGLTHVNKCYTHMHTENRHAILQGGSGSSTFQWRANVVYLTSKMKVGGSENYQRELNSQCSCSDSRVLLQWF